MVTMLANHIQSASHPRATGYRATDSRFATIRFFVSPAPKFGRLPRDSGEKIAKFEIEMKF